MVSLYMVEPEKCHTCVGNARVDASEMLCNEEGKRRCGVAVVARNGRAVNARDLNHGTRMVA